MDSMRPEIIVLKEFTDYGRKHGWLDSLKGCDHGTDSHLNAYHMEGDIFTHTMMVYRQAMNMVSAESEDMVDLLRLALLHDVGKPTMSLLVFSEKHGREVMRFSGHEYASALLAIPYLRENNYCGNDLTRMLSIIALHTYAFSAEVNDVLESVRAQRLLKLLSEADSHGRIAEDGGYDINDNMSTLAEYREKPDSDQWLTVMIGIPGSGKSTVAERYGEVFSNDDHVVKLARERSGENLSYNECFQYAKDNNIDWVDICRKDMVSYAVETGDDVVYDATNLTKKGRRKLLNKFSRHSINVRYVMVWRDLNECIAIREHEDKTVPVKVIKSMIPTFNEYNILEHVVV